MFDLMQAVAERDVQRVAANGATLFSSNYRFANREHLSLALIATAASQIATDKPIEAIELISRNVQRAERTPANALALDWLAAIAVARTNNRPAAVAQTKE